MLLCFSAVKAGVNPLGYFVLVFLFRKYTFTRITLSLYVIKSILRVVTFLCIL